MEHGQDGAFRAPLAIGPTAAAAKVLASMRNPARPSDPKAEKASNTGEAPRATHQFSRANPQVTHAPPAPKGKKPAVAPTIGTMVPSWLQPFSMPPNTRFTRTPDYLLRQPAPEPAPTPALPEPTTATAIPQRPSQTPVLRVPPRKPPLGAVPKALIAAHARRALSAQPTPADLSPADVTPFDLPAAEIAAEPPRSIRQIVGMIQLGWDVPPVMPAPQDEPPAWMPEEFAAANDPAEAQDDAEAEDAYFAGEAESQRFVAYDDDEEADFAEAFGDDFPEEDEEETDIAFVEQAIEAASAPQMPVVEAPAAEPPAASLPGFGYSVTPAEVSFSWPVIGMVPVATAEPAPAPVPAAAAPAPAPVPPKAMAPVAPPRPAPAPRPAPVETAEYELPPLELLTEVPANEPDYELSAEFLDRNSVKLQQVLHDFGVRGEIIDANPGPVVTLYELEPAPGIKSSRVIGLSADISRSMSALSARVAVVEGRNVIGIELPNQRRETVWLREMLASHEFEGAKAKLGIALGKTIGGEPVIVDLARMPHLLVAGTTGSGKSVAINTMILSLLYRHRPDQCRLIMIDPKMLELSVYEGIPHLLTPVVTDPKKAIVALKWAVREMEERYRKMSRLGVRNIDGFNARVAEAAAKGEIITRTVQKGFDRETGEVIEEEEIMDLAPLPYIVIVVDEMADLMMVAGKEIEGAIQRLAQMARAAGIHLIMATQRPSVDVITGTIKANFPTRISFQVTSKIDSRTILGEMGAEQLLGQGDMLYMAGGGRISRVHGPFVSDQEVERVVEHLKCQARPEYLDEVTAEDDEEPIAEDTAVFDKTEMGAESGDLYDQAVAVVMRDKKASTSYIQRRLQIGYNRAASIMERMENEGIVGPANHAGKREIIKDSR
jgi:S-DNA-T family DNA segregation ATPase FtsK/SpoIIIE